ncbi:MAG TPA: 6-phosphogluconolactonase [Candidatus Saccharimonadales bacterium]|nr:6-phosphogluconolactonase [Candidatus Saccharimonadales bacterium]
MTGAPGTTPEVASISSLDDLAGERVVSETAEDVADAVATWIAAQARRAYSDHGSFSIALSGGSTPRLLNEKLAGPEWQGRIDWSRWNVYFADERACPPDDPASNYHLAETTLLSRVSIDPGRVHRMPAERTDLDAAAAQYSDLLAGSLPAGRDGAPRLDVVLLGLGENGHTASLFPGTAALQVTDRWATRGLADYEPFDRMTLTFPAINAAAAVGFMVTGAAKHEALTATARGEVPASRVRPTDGTLAWFLDAAAAAG